MWETFVACCIAVCSLADTSGAQSRVSYWIGLGGGYASYGMEAVNRELEMRNNSPFSPVNFPEINGGADLCAEFGIAATPWLALGLSYERLFASTSFETVTQDMSANLYLGFVQLQTRAKSVTVGVDISGGQVSSAGKIEYDDGTEDIPIEGNAPAFQASAFVDIGLHRHLTVTPYAGYRVATITDVTVDYRLYVATQSYEIDYSGFFIGVKLKLLILRGG